MAAFEQGDAWDAWQKFVHLRALTIAAWWRRHYARGDLQRVFDENYRSLRDKRDKRDEAYELSENLRKQALDSITFGR